MSEPENRCAYLLGLVRAVDIAAMAETSTRAAPTINASTCAMIWSVGSIDPLLSRKYPTA